MASLPQLGHGVGRASLTACPHGTQRLFCSTSKCSTSKPTAGTLGRTRPLVSFEHLASRRQPVQGGRYVRAHAGAVAGGCRVIIMRHAESDSASELKDHDKPITAAGRAEAASVAARLREMGWVPDVILGSNSTRTRQTLDAMVSVLPDLGWVDAHMLGSLYTVAALDGMTRAHLEERILEVVGPLDAKCVLCLGHNKGWEEAASDFAGKPVRLQNATAALLECSADWEAAISGHEDNAWSLVDVIAPTA